MPIRTAPGRVRVIAGALRGRRLRTLPGGSVRPTAERVREALFDILGERITGAAFLDAYAGTGAVGIEALSRGARHVTLIEKDPRALAVLRRNLELAGERGREALVVPRDMARAVGILEADGAIFDIVYLDPPYEGGELERALRLLDGSRLLAEGAVVIAEHAARAAHPDHPRLVATRTVVHGRAGLTFYTRPPAR